MSNTIAHRERAKEVRFEFGQNWTRFLSLLDDDRIEDAEESLRRMLHVDTLAGKRFLDIGSGSGLFSLAARRMGAVVHSFDYDAHSVACTRELRRRFFPEDPQWTVEEGSALDAEYVASLGTFDVVYSWGVLHHTGEMWRGMENAVTAVAPGGSLFIAIYNDQRWISRYWKAVKVIFNRNAALRGLMIAGHSPYLLGGRFLVRAMTGRLRPERGMTLWYDMLDWLGGYPFEVARPEEVFQFCRERGFQLVEMTTCGGRMGCNEFVFVRG